MRSTFRKMLLLAATAALFAQAEACAPNNGANGGGRPNGQAPAVQTSVDVTTVGNGSVASSPAGLAVGANSTGSATFQTAPITLTATPAAGWVFDHWEDLGDNLLITQPNNPTVTLAPDGGTFKLKAVFKPAHGGGGGGGGGQLAPQGTLKLGSMIEAFGFAPGSNTIAAAGYDDGNLFLIDAGSRRVTDTLPAWQRGTRGLTIQGNTIFGVAPDARSAARTTIPFGMTTLPSARRRGASPPSRARVGSS
jgi:hypothetical protein